MLYSSRQVKDGVKEHSAIERKPKVTGSVMINFWDVAS